MKRRTIISNETSRASLLYVEDELVVSFFIQLERKTLNGGSFVETIPLGRLNTLNGVFVPPRQP